MLSAERTCLWPEGSAPGQALLCEFRMGWIWESIDSPASWQLPSRASPARAVRSLPRPQHLR